MGSMWNIVVTTLHALTLLVIAGGYVIASANPSGWAETTWATLVGALIAGAMTLGGGFLAYVSATSATRIAQQNYQNDRNDKEHNALLYLERISAEIRKEIIEKKKFIDVAESYIEENSPMPNSLINVIKINSPDFLKNNDDFFYHIGNDARYCIYQMRSLFSEAETKYNSLYFTSIKEDGKIKISGLDPKSLSGDFMIDYRAF